jgi:SNF2 family DNA or RNA helicase
MGLGKTLTSLWSAEMHGATRILVLCPLSLVETVWVPAVTQEFAGKFLPIPVTGDWHKKKAALDRADKALARRKPAVLIMNHDGTRVFHSQFRTRPICPDFVIIDESTAYKSVSAKRTQGALAMTASAPRVILATGTPITTSPMDLYGQARFVCPGEVPKTEAGFRSLTMVSDPSGLGWEPAPQWEERVKKVFTFAHRKRLRDCVELPDVVMAKRKVPLTSQQKAVLRNVERHGHILASSAYDERAAAIHASALRQEAMRVAAGVGKIDGNTYATIDAAPRLELLDQLVEESESPPVIFSQHVPVVEFIAARYDVPAIHGAASQRERVDAINDFRDGLLRALVCHPGVMAHGVDLTCANHVIFYQPPATVEQWLQAIARIERLGQTSRMLVTMFEGCKLEEHIWGRLESRMDTVDKLEDVLELISEDL